MQTPGIEADILQRPLAPGKSLGSVVPNVDIRVDCQNLFNSEMIFLAITCTWLIICVWWCLLNCKFYKNQTTMLQKLLTILPLLKLVDTFAYYLFLQQCPWISERTEFAAKYLIMALVTVSSIYQSVAIGVMMMISCGWTLLHNQMSRDYATRVTVTMGVIYLCYSAYYVSLPNSAFRVFMEGFLVFTYAYIFYF